MPKGPNNTKQNQTRKKLFIDSTGIMNSKILKHHHYTNALKFQNKEKK